MNFGQSAGQKNLFQSNLNVRFRLKSTLRAAAAASPLSRAQIVDGMSQICRTDGISGARGNAISVANLDAWMAESKPNQIPIQLLPVFCRVVGSVEPLSVLAEPLGGEVIDGRQAQLLAWAEAEFASRKLARRKRRLMSEIEGPADE